MVKTGFVAHFPDCPENIRIVAFSSGVKIEGCKNFPGSQTGCKMQVVLQISFHIAAQNSKIRRLLRFPVSEVLHQDELLFFPDFFQRLIQVIKAVHWDKLYGLKNKITLFE